VNRHIEFRDGTELGLMTVVGVPTSPMARDYATLLAAGEGGVYTALWTTELKRVQDAAAQPGRPRLTQAGGWQFLSLPGVPDVHAVFFGAGDLFANDADSVLVHPNGAQGLAAAWLEGGRMLDALLLLAAIEGLEDASHTRWSL